MTFRAAIQKLQNDLDQVYESAGVLRDSAVFSEKETFSEVRTLTRNAMEALSKLDNKISDNRAQMELKYTV